MRDQDDRLGFGQPLIIRPIGRRPLERLRDAIHHPAWGDRSGWAARYRCPPESPSRLLPTVTRCLSKPCAFAPGLPGPIPGLPGTVPGAPGVIPGSPAGVPRSPGFNPATPGLIPGAAAVRPGTPARVAATPAFITGIPAVAPGAADGDKTPYYLLRWVNTKGEKGPWSATYSATILA